MAKENIAQSRAHWTAAELREHLTYNPDTGEFWTTPRKIGTVSYFGKTRVPAVTIQLKGKDGKWRHYYAHILAWLWMTGEWPRDEIDHINTDSIDNRWVNLREGTHQQNNWNKDFAKRKKNGFLGAHYHKRSGLWRATLARKTLGYFKTPEEAHEAYKKAAIAKYGEFAHNSLSERLAPRNPVDDDASGGLGTDEVQRGES
jgi:HNH endonuclease